MCPACLLVETVATTGATSPGGLTALLRAGFRTDAGVNRGGAPEVVHQSVNEATQALARIKPATTGAES